jgi:tripartite-type tricarboxylate transporter receptor subunit TctC
MPTMLLIPLLGLLLRPDQAGAQSPYYKGKVINVVVGTTAGSAYDVYSRLIAQHIGKHIVNHRIDQPSALFQSTRWPQRSPIRLG